MLDVHFSIISGAIFRLLPANLPLVWLILFSVFFLYTDKKNGENFNLLQNHLIVGEVIPICICKLVRPL